MTVKPTLGQQEHWLSNVCPSSPLREWAGAETEEGDEQKKASNTGFVKKRAQILMPI